MQRFFKKCAAYVIRNIAMHNKHLAQEVVRAGGLNALGQILTEFDPSVKEAACWAISYIAK
jgi:Armadillo/beta-catenin-like repeat